MNIPVTPRSLAECFIKNAEKLSAERDSLSHVTLDFYIVTVQDLPIAYTDGKPSTSTLKDASRFVNFEVAANRAKITFNGADVRGDVSTLRHAYIKQIEHLHQLAFDLINQGV